MREYVVGNAMNLIKEKYSFDDIRLEELNYGLLCTYTMITKLVVMLCISLLIGLLKNFILFTIFFSLLRGIGCGYHADKNWKCWIFSSTIYILSSYLASILYINIYLMIIMAISASIILIYYTPADTKKRPIISQDLRKRKKILMSIICSIYLVLIALYNNDLLRNILVISMIMQTIMINPLTYKIFNEPYNNYIDYQKKKGKI